LDKAALLSRYTPCKYDKHNAKGQGTSLSCLKAGYTVATGKYGIISVDQTTGQSVGWTRDEKTGKVSQAEKVEVLVGDEDKGESQAAPAPTEEPTPKAEPEPKAAPAPAPKKAAAAAPAQKKAAAAAAKKEEEEDYWEPVD
jgi:hypothetical protein